LTYPTPQEAKELLLVTMPTATTRLIGVDPGDTTGVYVLYRELAHVGMSFTYEPFLKWVINRGMSPAVFVVEQFVARPAAFAKEQIAGKVCGACDFYCALRKFPLHYQQPSTIKTMLPDNQALKDAGWTWNTPHERDALRHCLYYLLTRK
jgi:hypothetical protein